ncbi:Dna-J like membrane chaperone protein [Phyllosticta capitalensis]
MSAKASGADTNGGDGARNRANNGSGHHDGSAGRAYTVEQKAAVLRIKRCSPTAFYEILGLEDRRATCSDAEIKKSYRKLSLLTHPDKNGYEGADEAFKMVSRAFQVLSDRDKKEKYDKFGGDPDNRFGGGASASAESPFSGFRTRGGGGPRGPMFEEEISPEEMFRQFFGGGMGGPGIFDTGPGFVFNLNGGPGIRVHQFGGARPRRRPANAAAEPAPSLGAALQSLLPLLLLFIVPLLSSLFSGSGSSPGPTIRLDAAIPPHTHQRISERLHINYFVDPREVEELSKSKLRDLDREAEGRYMRKLNLECDAEYARKNDLFLAAKGWFFTDEERLRQARDLPMPSCERLASFGYARR